MAAPLVSVMRPTMLPSAEVCADAVNAKTARISGREIAATANGLKRWFFIVFSCGVRSGQVCNHPRNISDGLLGEKCLSFTPEILLVTETQRGVNNTRRETAARMARREVRCESVDSTGRSRGM